MGLTERHWFEEEDILNERQLENEVEYGERRYQAGYKKGYADALASWPRECVRQETALEKDGHHIRCVKCNSYWCITDCEGNAFPINYCPECGRKVKWDA